MRLFSTILAAALLVGCVGSAVEDAPPEDPLLPGGYKLALDTTRADPGHFTITDTAGVVRFTSGPAGVAWRPQDVFGAGDFQVEATFRLYGAPVAYHEGYGIFVGGRELESSDQSYAYLMIRPSGDFTIRTRKGDLTETVVEWTPHVAVQPVGQDGDEPVNRLVIQVRGADADFLLNGTRVFSMDAKDLRPQGLAGVRINHRLDVGLTSWSLGPPPSLAADSTPGT